MVPAGRGLIVIISSIGGLQYLFSVPYGVGKAAVRTHWDGLGWRTVPVPLAQERWFPAVQAVRLTGPHLFLCPCIDSSLAWAPLSWPASALGKVGS